MDDSTRTLKCNAPIGVFDSGVGGLSVVRALTHALPNEALLYVGDEANCPYGTRPAEEIIAFGEEITRYLTRQGVKLIVVACNTVSAVALTDLRALFPEMTFVGMVPAVKPAVQITRTGVVGVMATPTTIAGQLYQDVVRQCADGKRILSQACPGLVELVQAGDLDSPKALALMRAYVEPLLAEGVDTLVLGCSHYPFLIPALRQLTGDRVQFVEASDAIARRTAHVLEAADLLRQAADKPETLLATTGDPEHFAFVLRRLLGYEGQVRSLHWGEGGIVDASLMHPSRVRGRLSQAAK
jgi:glutamate racemase